MNSRNSQKYKRWQWGITSTLIGSAAVIIAATNVATPSAVKAEQLQPEMQHSKGETLKLIAQSQMPQRDMTMPQCNMMKQGMTMPQCDMMMQSMMMQSMMMAGEKTDRHFIVMMISHHEGAVKMADLALKLSKRPEIRQLAESIKSDQIREIAQMKSWYKQWYGTSVPSAMAIMNQGNMMDMKKPMEMPMTKPMGMPMTKPMGMPMTKPMGMPMGMQSMMTGDLNALESAPDFDKAFIKEMIPHHKMALMMSSMIVDSDRPEMRTLSTAIAQAQSTEIEQMRQWYKAWYK
jgi:uncharacterized protein (DUF305 family)